MTTWASDKLVINTETLKNATGAHGRDDEHRTTEVCLLCVCNQHKVTPTARGMNSQMHRSQSVSLWVPRLQGLKQGFEWGEFGEWAQEVGSGAREPVTGESLSRGQLWAWAGPPSSIPRYHLMHLWAVPSKPEGEALSSSPIPTTGGLQSPTVLGNPEARQQGSGCRAISAQQPGWPRVEEGAWPGTPGAPVSNRTFTWLCSSPRSSRQNVRETWEVTRSPYDFAPPTLCGEQGAQLIRSCELFIENDGVLGCKKCSRPSQKAPETAEYLEENKNEIWSNSNYTIPLHHSQNKVIHHECFKFWIKKMIK